MRTAKTLIRLGGCLRWAHSHFVGFVMSRLFTAVYDSYHGHSSLFHFLFMHFSVVLHLLELGFEPRHNKTIVNSHR